jgi:hypothetical protein
MNYRELRASEPQGTWETWMRAVLKVARFVLLLLTIPVVYVLCDNPMDKQAAMRGKLEQLQAERATGLESDRRLGGRAEHLEFSLLQFERKLDRLAGKLDLMIERKRLRR